MSEQVAIFLIVVIVGCVMFAIGWIGGRASAYRRMVATGEALRRIGEQWGLTQLPGERDTAFRSRINEQIRDGARRTSHRFDPTRGN